MANKLKQAAKVIAPKTYEKLSKLKNKKFPSYSLAVALAFGIAFGVIGDKIFSAKSTKKQRALLEEQIRQFIESQPNYVDSLANFEAAHAKQIEQIQSNIEYQQKSERWHLDDAMNTQKLQLWKSLSTGMQKKLIEFVKQHEIEIGIYDEPYKWLDEYHYIVSTGRAEDVFGLEEKIYFADGWYETWNGIPVDSMTGKELLSYQRANPLDKDFKALSGMQIAKKKGREIKELEDKRDSWNTAAKTVTSDLQLKLQKQEEKNRRYVDSVYLSKNLVRKK
ncbi:MAG: hypothetical protein FWF97_00540 [Alphaproteobacteria bacterium]|nr:hypothetical protein [Alphaproteobacteria bacterium]